MLPRFQLLLYKDLFPQPLRIISCFVGLCSPTIHKVDTPLWFMVYTLSLIAVLSSCASWVAYLLIFQRNSDRLLLCVLLYMTSLNVLSLVLAITIKLKCNEQISKRFALVDKFLCSSSFARKKYNKNIMLLFFGISGYFILCSIRDLCFMVNRNNIFIYVIFQLNQYMVFLSSFQIYLLITSARLRYTSINKCLKRSVNTSIVIRNIILNHGSFMSTIKTIWALNRSHSILTSSVDIFITGYWLQFLGILGFFFIGI